MLPLLGPYTLRDGFGFLADFGTAWAINFPPVYQGTIGWVVTPVAMVDTRSNTDFRYYGTGSVFEYDDVRFLYVRKTLIQDDAIRLWHRSAPPDPRRKPANESVRAAGGQPGPRFGLGHGALPHYGSRPRGAQRKRQF